MKHRPWPLIILGIVQICMPIFDVLLNSIVYDIAPFVYLKEFIRIKSALEIFDFFALAPIAGIGILLMKAWSYPLFLLISLWTISTNSYIWFTQDVGTISLPTLIAVNLTNLVLVTYYLLPAVRRVYFEKHIRWWESKPRFLVDFASGFINGGKSFQCSIQDISEGGAFLKTDQNLSTDSVINVAINLMGYKFDVEAEVVHVREGAGIGVMFDHSRNSLKTTKQLLKQLRTEGYEIRHKPTSTWKSFEDWLMGLIKEGKGLLP